MANWRDTILKNFKPKISRLTLVADPDGLLTEEGMLSAIRERGFDLIPFDDPIAFRFAYESQYRSQWDQGQNTDLVVVLRSAEQQLNKLPYDLLKAGRPLTFALHQVVPEAELPGDRRAGPGLPRRRGRGVPEARRRAVDRAGDQGVRADALLRHRAEAHQDAGRTAEGVAVAPLPQGAAAGLPGRVPAGEPDQRQPRSRRGRWPTSSPAGRSSCGSSRTSGRSSSPRRPIRRSRAGSRSATRTCGPTSTRSSSTAR